MAKIIDFVKHNSGFILVSLIYLVSIIYLLPLRNQVFGDDFAYALSVKRSIENTKLIIIDWAAASVVAQVIWGSIFSKILGFSLETLQISTITIFYIGLAFFYLILRFFKIESLRSGIFTSILFLFPWTFRYTFTFYSELHYISYLLVSSYFYLNGLRNNNNIYLLLGSLFAGLAFLTRQTGISLVAAALLVLVYRCWINKRVNLAGIFASCAPYVILALFYYSWLNQPGNLTWGQSTQVALFKRNTLPYLLPLNLNLGRVTNDLYMEQLFRIGFYYSNIVGLIFPVILIFRAVPRKVYIFLKTNIKSIFFLLLLSLPILISYRLTVADIHNDFPREVTSDVKYLTLNWKNWWGYFVRLSSLFFIPLIAVYLKNIHSLFFKPRQLKKAGNFILLTTILIALIAAFQIKIFSVVFRPLIPLHSNVISTIGIYLSAIASPAGLERLGQSWAILVIFFVIGVTIIYSITNYRISIKHEVLANENSFLFLTFIFQLGIIVFFTYFRWPQYVLILLPFFIIWLAKTTSSYKLNYLLSFIVLLIMFIFSATSTKITYQSLGIQWEIGTRIVNNLGARPADVSVSGASWAWMPWWYYEESFSKAVELIGGNKHFLGHGEPWIFYYQTQSPVAYNIIPVDLSFDPKSEREEKIVYDSGSINFGLFEENKRYIVIEYQKPKEQILGSPPLPIPFKVEYQ